jgi:hypothetical protein
LVPLLLTRLKTAQQPVILLYPIAYVQLSHFSFGFFVALLLSSTPFYVVVILSPHFPFPLCPSLVSVDCVGSSTSIPYHSIVHVVLSIVWTSFEYISANLAALEVIG